MAKFCSQESQSAVLALAVHLALHHAACLLHTTHVLRHFSRLPGASQHVDQLAMQQEFPQGHSAFLHGVHIRHVLLELCCFALLHHNMSYAWCRASHCCCCMTFPLYASVLLSSGETLVITTQLFHTHMSFNRHFRLAAATAAPRQGYMQPEWCKAAVCQFSAVAVSRVAYGSSVCQAK